MRHLNLEMERLEQRIAPGGLTGGIGLGLGLGVGGTPARPPRAPGRVLMTGARARAASARSIPVLPDPVTQPATRCPQRVPGGPPGALSTPRFKIPSQQSR